MTPSAVRRAKWRYRLVVALLAVVSMPEPSAGKVLGVELQPQRGPLWCWLASAEMVNDYLYGDVGQCSLAECVPLTGCACSPPNGYLEVAECAQATPFDTGDYMLKVLTGESRWLWTAEKPDPVSPNFVRCEIEKREAPMVVWWKNGACVGDGHLAVASGITTSTAGTVVFVLDPWPPLENGKGGEKYWLSWTGFACGRNSGGHCAAYYNLGPSLVTCDTQQMQTDCDGTGDALQVVGNLEQVEPYVTTLLSGENATELRRALDVELGALTAKCDPTTVLREVRPAINSQNEVSYSRTGRLRIFCTVTVGSSSFRLSALVKDPGVAGEPLAFIGVGAGEWTDWLSAVSALLVAEAGPQSGAQPRELLELSGPGRGEAVVIDQRKPFAKRALRYGQLAIKPWETVLAQPVPPGASDFAEVLRDWALRSGSFSDF
jgi:hypothetical protein